ncbi:MAG TPA: undecaprenyl-diphosphate phosphatase [Candidatus Paceibacterota bacterium]|nr:undecaprenyl-diphosphate phosphatase [Candidatus Paceibacterota bacterium]
MLNELFFAFVQALTEFLPVSSSGHLALFSFFFGEINLFFITFLHLASLFAVLLFTRKEIFKILRFKKEDRPLLFYLIIATIPAAIFGLFFEDIVERSFNNLLFLSFGFLFTGTILFFTKFVHLSNKSFTFNNSILIGLFQVLALFPGVSRSGMTISAGMFSGINKEKITKFSFLLFIPLSIGSFLLKAKDYLSVNKGFDFSLYSLLLPFFVCFILSIIFLNLLYYVIKKEKFWLFSIYCWFVGILCLVFYLFN